MASIGRKRSVTLQDCITDFCREETLSENEKWYCSTCKDHKCAYKVSIVFLFLIRISVRRYDSV